MLTFHKFRPHSNIHSFPTRRSSDLGEPLHGDRAAILESGVTHFPRAAAGDPGELARDPLGVGVALAHAQQPVGDRKSTRLNSSHITTSYAVFCLKKKNWRIQPAEFS